MSLTNSLPKSPEKEWQPYLSKRRLDEWDVRAVSDVLGISAHDVWTLHRRSSVRRAVG